MTIETILIINSVVLGLAAIALAFCVSIWLKAEKKAAYYKQRELVLKKELDNVAQHCSELQIQVDVCEDRVKAAYELGYKESKMSIINEIYEQCCNHKLATVKKWLVEKYNIEVKDGE